MITNLGRDDGVLQLPFYTLIRQRKRGLFSSYNLCKSALLKATQTKDFMKKMRI